jgi:hypothetical protein
MLNGGSSLCWFAKFILYKCGIAIYGATMVGGTLQIAYGGSHRPAVMVLA